MYVPAEYYHLLLLYLVSVYAANHYPVLIVEFPFVFVHFVPYMTSSDFLTGFSIHFNKSS